MTDRPTNSTARHLVLRLLVCLGAVVALTCFGLRAPVAQPVAEGESVEEGAVLDGEATGAFEPWGPGDMALQVGGGVLGLLIHGVVAAGSIGLGLLALPVSDYVAYILLGGGFWSLPMTPVSMGAGVSTMGEHLGGAQNVSGVVIGFALSFVAWLPSIWLLQGAGLSSSTAFNVWFVGLLPAGLLGQVLGYHIEASVGGEPRTSRLLGDRAAVAAGDSPGPPLQLQPGEQRFMFPLFQGSF